MNIKMNDIDNTKLEEVMQAYAKEPDKEKLAQLVFALQDTELFVPAMTTQKKGSFRPYFLKNAQGDLYMPAFTSMKKFPQGQKYQGMLRLKYGQCVSMLLDNQAPVQGIALNPYADNLMLKTQMLELSRKVGQQAETAPKTYTVKADDFHMMLRNQIEFQVIPKKLFAQKLEFVQGVSAETLCGLYEEAYAGVGQEGNFPYGKDDFEIMELNIRDDLKIIQVTAPSKYLYQTNCREIYVVCNPQTGQVGYYVIEKGMDSEGGGFYLDAVREDGAKERLEEAPSEGNVMNRVMELFGGGL